jgi:hypothetical protein
VGSQFTEGCWALQHFTEATDAVRHIARQTRYNELRSVIESVSCIGTKRHDVEISDCGAGNDERSSIRTFTNGDAWNGVLHVDSHDWWLGCNEARSTDEIWSRQQPSPQSSFERESRKRMLGGGIISNAGHGARNVHQLLPRGNCTMDESERFPIMHADTDLETNT